MRRADLPGFTLVEIMVYMTLLVLILGSSMVVMLMANRFFKSTLDNNAVQREAQTTMLRLSRELEESKRGLVKLNTENETPGVVFISPRNDKGEYVYDYSGDGELFWQKWACYYVGPGPDGDARLYRGERSLGAAAIAPEATTLTILDFHTDSERRETVANDLISFEIAADIATADTYNIRASFGREGRTNNTDGDRMAEKVDLETSVHLRN